jgi:hypothetical protein
MTNEGQQNMAVFNQLHGLQSLADLRLAQPVKKDRRWTLFSAS